MLYNANYSRIVNEYDYAGRAVHDYEHHASFYDAILVCRFWNVEKDV